MERAGRGRKASWVPGSCSSPRCPAGAQGCGGPSPSLAPVCSGRLLWAPMERRACAFPWRPPRAVLCPAAAFRRSAACIRCRTCAPPTRSLSVDTALWRALGTAGCYTPWSLCQAVLGLPLLPSRSLAGAACLCGPMTACVVHRLPALSRHILFLVLCFKRRWGPRFAGQVTVTRLAHPPCPQK